MPTSYHPPALSIRTHLDASRLPTWYGSARVVVQPKLDGLAAECVYADGRLLLVLSRSRKEIERGSEITGIPATIGTAAILRIRGEIVMPRSAWSGPCSCRHAASSAAMSPRGERASLRFVAYSVSGLDTETETEMVAALAALGFEVPATTTTTDPAAVVESAWTSRPADYDCDGLVVKIDDRHEQARLGTTATDLRWAAALKWFAH